MQQRQHQHRVVAARGGDIVQRSLFEGYVVDAIARRAGAPEFQHPVGKVHRPHMGDKPRMGQRRGAGAAADFEHVPVGAQPLLGGHELALVDRRVGNRASGVSG